jgi:uncharacterized coiled-coil DUF342 family protein
MNEKDLVKKWNNRKLIEETISSMGEHNNPSPETREQLAVLKTNYNYLMEKVDEIKEENYKQHEELKNAIVKIDEKLDTALTNKADKKEVEELQKSVKELDVWKIRIVAIFSVIMFLITFFKDILLEKIIK